MLIFFNLFESKFWLVFGFSQFFPALEFLFLSSYMNFFESLICILLI